jgi:hypothetical protein
MDSRQCGTQGPWHEALNEQTRQSTTRCCSAAWFFGRRPDWVKSGSADRFARLPRTRPQYLSKQTRYGLAECGPWWATAGVPFKASGGDDPVSGRRAGVAGDRPRRHAQAGLVKCAMLCGQAASHTVRRGSRGSLPRHSLTQTRQNSLNRFGVKAVCSLVIDRWPNHAWIARVSCGFQPPPSLSFWGWDDHSVKKIRPGRRPKLTA